MEIKIKEKIVSNSLLGSTTKTKRAMALVIFLAFFSISLLVLFNIDGISLIGDKTRMYVWDIGLVVIFWYAARIATRNIKKAFFAMHASYAFSIILIAYCATVAILMKDYVPHQWGDLKGLFIWLAPVFGINLIWKVLFYFVEMHVRPFFALKMIWEALINLILIVFLTVGILMVDTFVINKKAFDLKDTTNFLYLMLYGIGTMVIIAIEIMIYKRFWRFTAYGRESAKSGMIWNALMKMGSATVWFLVKGNYYDFNMRFGIYIGVAAFLLISLLIYSFTRRTSGGSSNVFSLMSSAIIMVLIFLAFGEEMLMHGNINPYLAILLPSMVLIYILFLVLDPPVSWVSARAFSAVSSAVSIYTIVVWAVGHYIGKTLPLLPFDINELLMIPILIATIALMLATIYTSLKSYSSINFNIGRIMKTQKGAKHAKK